MNLLTFRHHRRLCEEIALLPVGCDVVVLVATTHPNFIKFWKPILYNFYVLERVCTPFDFNGVTFFSIPMTVTNSPQRDFMMNGSLDKNDVIWRLSYHCGEMVEMVASHPSSSDFVKFFFSDFILHCDTLHVWSEGPYSNVVSRRINRIIKEEDRNKLGFRILDELMGDSCRSMHLIQALNNKSDSDKRKNQLDELMKLKTTASIGSLCHLSSSYGPFVEFHNIVKDMCSTTIDGCYGRFSKLTSPILSEKQLAHLDEKFRSLLGEYSEILSNMLIDERRRNRKQCEHLAGYWNRKVLYSFFALMRQRNKNFFKEWAVINSGATYAATISGISKLSVYYGCCVDKSCFNKFLLQKSNYDEFISNAKKILANEDCIYIYFR